MSQVEVVKSPAFAKESDGDDAAHFHFAAFGDGSLVVQDGEYVHGFGVYETDSQKGKMKLNPVNFSLAIEGGANYRFNKLMRFTAALYFSYCLTNLHKDSMQPILTEEYEYKGTMQSNQIDHASLLSLGLKAGVVLDVNELFSSKAARRPKF